LKDQIEITEAMIKAATATGKASGAIATNARHADVKRMLAAGLAELRADICGAPFDLVIDTTLTKKRGRFLGVAAQRGYFRVECEDGQLLTVHGNDIHDGGRDRKQQLKTTLRTSE
jgi:hypothetical protein